MYVENVSVKTSNKAVCNKRKTSDYLLFWQFYKIIIFSCLKKYIKKILY